MAQRAYLFLSAAIFAVVALLHVLRAFLQLVVRIGSEEVPIAVSWVGALIAAALAVWGLVLAGKSGPSHG